MPPQFFIRNLSLALCLLLTAGCAQYNSDGGGYSDPYYDQYSQTGSDDLLAFAANMAKMPASSRAKTCRTLLKRQKKNPGAEIQLQLMVGRLHSDTCGYIPKILSNVNAIPQGRINGQTQQLIAIYKDALKRLNIISQKQGSLECNLNDDGSELEPNDANRSKKNETRLLREKLEAIRSMEKHLDDSDKAK